jgi:hypothetical protein
VVLVGRHIYSVRYPEIGRYSVKVSNVSSVRRGRKHGWRVGTERVSADLG